MSEYQQSPKEKQKEPELLSTVAKFSLHSIIQEVELDLLCVCFNRGLLLPIVLICHTAL